MEFKEIQQVISKENILILLLSMGVLVGFQLIQRWFKQREYQKAMKRWVVDDTTRFVWLYLSIKGPYY